MTFVTHFNYFKKSIDSIFYSTPQIFEEIMALRHSLLTFKQVGCHCFLFMLGKSFLAKEGLGPHKAKYDVDGTNIPW